MGHMFSVKNWLKELAFPYDYCEALKTSEGVDNKSAPYILQTRKNRIYSLQQHSEKNIHDSVIFSNLKYSFFSPTLHVETVEIKSRQKILQDSTVSRYIKKLDLFEEGFNYCYDVLSFDGKTAVVNIFVLSSVDASENLKLVPYLEKPVSCLVPLEYVIINMLNNTSTNPVVSAWTDNQQVLILVTKGKEIISRDTYVHPGEKSEFFKWLISNKYIQNSIDSVKQQEPDQEVSLLVWGEHYKHLKNILQQKLNMPIDEILEDNINRKFNWKNNSKRNDKELVSRKGKVDKKRVGDSKSIIDVNIDSLFSNPSLFGLALCHKSQTFISPGYDITYSKYIYSRYTLMLSVVFFVIFSVLNSSTFFTQKELESKLFQSIDTLESGINQIEPRIPDDKRLLAVLEKAKFKKTLYTELNVDNFLGWMTNITPENAVIDQLLIESVAKVKTTGNKRRNKEPDLSKQYKVDLRVLLNRAYTDSVSHIDIFFVKLNEKVKSPKSKFIYLNKDDKVPSALSLSFLVDPAMFF